MKETRILVDKINSRERMKKTKWILSSEVEVLRSAHKKIMKEEVKQEESLEADIVESQAECEQNIYQIRRNVMNKVNYRLDRRKKN